MNASKPTPSLRLAITMPPSTPVTSVYTVSSGITMTSASILGSTSRSCAPTPMVRSASTSSVTFIVPICAVYAEPERPAMMMAVSSGDSSRSIASATRSTTKMLAPKRCS